MLWEFFSKISSFSTLGMFLEVLIIFAVPTVLAAAAIAWVIHCPIVMVLSRRKKSTAQLTIDH